ncbi:MAG: signal recognition particle subunit SRP19/SEC65 family protein [Thermoplasmatota archaeon]
MVSKGGDRFVLWPRYFDAALSRGQGRRVPKHLAVEKPDAAWIASAAKKAKVAPELEEGAKDPLVPWKSCDRVLVAKVGSKEEVIKKVAEQLQGGSPKA